MSGHLEESPADIIRQLLVDLSLGTEPSADGSWPIHSTQEPDQPDDCITVYDTEGTQDGRSMIDGERFIHFGFQVRVRHAKHETGYHKADDIAMALDKTVYQNTVTIGANTYLVHAVSRKSGPLALGREPGTGRVLFTINAVASIRQTT